MQKQKLRRLPIAYTHRRDKLVGHKLRPLWRRLTHAEKIRRFEKRMSVHDAKLNAAFIKGAPDVGS